MSESPEEGEEWHETNESFDAGKHGKDYELQIAKFLFKRLLDADYHNFKFTREKRGLGKFDDLAYICENEGQKRFGLVQLKHILDPTRKIGYVDLATNPNSYFLLSKYFTHYNESLISLSTDKDFVDAKLEALIICTNIGFEDDLKDIKKSQVNNISIFGDSGTLYQLNISDHLKRDIFASNYLTDRQKLANELVYYIMCNKLIDLNSLIKDDHVSMLRTYHVSLAKYVIDVPNKKIKPEFLESSSYDDDEVIKFRDCLFKSFSDFYLNYGKLSSEELTKVLKIKLKNSEKLKNRLSSYRSASSVEEFLKAQLLEIRSNFGDVTNFPNDTTSLPTKDYSADNIDQKIDDFLSLLIFATDENNIENIIRKELSPELFISFNDKMNRWYHDGSFEEHKGSTLRKRKWITKEKLLANAMEEDSVLFQGKNIKLKQLIKQTAHICPEMVLRLFCEKLPSIGREPPGLGDIRNYYIPRVLTSQRVVHKDALEKCTDDIFIITSAKHSILKTNLKIAFHKITEDISRCDINAFRIFVIPENFCDKTLRKFVRENFLVSDKCKNIHWIKIHKNSLIWQNTFGALTELKRYLSDSSPTVKLFTEDDLTGSQFIIVSGEPGIGKSTLLNSFSEKLTKNNENLDDLNWIIKVDLKDCYEILKDCPEFQNLEDVFKFLAFLENANDSLSRVVLKDFVMDNERIILLLDGFDELRSDEEQEKIIQLINIVRLDLRFKQIWLTTRPHFVEKLEKRFGVISFSLKEINEDEQVSFLSRFLESKCHLKRGSYTAHQVVEKFNKTLHGQCKSFLGTPLHTYMFATVFVQHVIREDTEIPEYLKVTTLFDSFLQAKYDIYFRKTGENILPNDKKQKLLRNLLDNAHKDFAIRYGRLLPPKAAELLDTNNYSFEDDDLLDIGIVYKRKDQFYFSNQSFAEYLVAKRLVEIAIRENDQKRTLVKDILFKIRNNFLIFLFDMKLTEHFPLHCAVLNGDVKRVKEFTKNEINAEDCFGRRLIYYALHYRKPEMMDILIDKGALINGKDKFSAQALFQKMS